MPSGAALHLASAAAATTPAVIATTPATVAPPPPPTVPAGGGALLGSTRDPAAAVGLSIGGEARHRIIPYGYVTIIMLILW